MSGSATYCSRQRLPWCHLCPATVCMGSEARRFASVAGRRGGSSEPAMGWVVRRSVGSWMVRRSGVYCANSAYAPPRRMKVSPGDATPLRQPKIVSASRVSSRSLRISRICSSE